jgi:hypothetical protein
MTASHYAHSVTYGQNELRLAMGTISTEIVCGRAAFFWHETIFVITGKWDIQNAPYL